MLAANLRAARDWARRIEASEALTLYQPPELDIVNCFPTLDRPTMTAIDAASAAVLHAGMRERDPVFLSTLRVTGEALEQRHASVVKDAASARILRSALMKPESELGDLVARSRRRTGGAGPGRRPRIRLTGHLTSPGHTLVVDSPMPPSPPRIAAPRGGACPRDRHVVPCRS
ncbi:hypothetical protein OV079_50885 [Nannocystis pusilla]|uniref:Uncharacterized protein n=1 Tax=Nannocystis pusilla TaxID=889268 RepID=A0A9X3F0F3_9BACT|nr:hypothetical protein [Nannocystis pusilla]MCY1013702.1 hypothetical protein [Nannocystis pusilla]